MAVARGSTSRSRPRPADLAGWRWGGWPMVAGRYPSTVLWLFGALGLIIVVVIGLVVLGRETAASRDGRTAGRVRSDRGGRVHRRPAARADPGSHLPRGRPVGAARRRRPARGARRQTGRGGATSMTLEGGALRSIDEAGHRPHPRRSPTRPIGTWPTMTSSPCSTVAWRTSRPSAPSGPEPDARRRRFPRPVRGGVPWAPCRVPPSSSTTATSATSGPRSSTTSTTRRRSSSTS